MEVLKQLIFNSSSKEQLDLDVNDEKYPTQIYDPILGSLIFSSGKKTLYSTRMKQLINNKNVTIWELNRPLDTEHVNIIHNALNNEYKLTNQITVFGSLGVFKHDKHYKIFDGQHRLAALNKLLEQYPALNPQLTIEVYDTDDPINLFSSLNQIKPQELNHNPSTKKEQLAHMIQEKFKDGIRNQLKTNRPRITLKSIMDTINTSDFCDENNDSIINRIIQHNIKLSKLGLRELFGKEYDKNNELCHRIYNHASNINFYLGIKKLKNGRINLN